MITALVFCYSALVRISRREKKTMENNMQNFEKKWIGPSDHYVDM